MGWIILCHFCRCGCGCGFRSDLEIRYRSVLVDLERSHRLQSLLRGSSLQGLPLKDFPTRSFWEGLLESLPQGFSSPSLISTTASRVWGSSQPRHNRLRFPGRSVCGGFWSSPGNRSPSSLRWSLLHGILAFRWPFCWFYVCSFWLPFDQYVSIMFTCVRLQQNNHLARCLLNSVTDSRDNSENCARLC